MKFFVLNILFVFVARICFAQHILVVKYVSQADLKVYATKNASQADLKVIKVNYTSQLNGNNGKWLFVKQASLADKKIAYVNYPSQANLIIYFVITPTLAGWINANKKYLLDK